MNRILTQLQNSHQIWHGNNHHLLCDVLPSGYQSLDDFLSGGLPDNSVIELRTINGIGELRLFMPYIAQKTVNDRLAVFIAPPSSISAQTLASNDINPEQVLVLNSKQAPDMLWSAEQCLKSGCVGVAILWHQQFSNAQTKRLKLAALQGQASLIIMRQPTALVSPLPVPLSLTVSPDKHGLKIAINKQLGHWPKSPYSLDMRSQWPDLVEQDKPNNVISISKRKVG